MWFRVGFKFEFVNLLGEGSFCVDERGLIGGTESNAR